MNCRQGLKSLGKFIVSALFFWRNRNDFFTDNTCGIGECFLSRGKQINSRRTKCFHGSGRQLCHGFPRERDFIFYDAARKNFGRGGKIKLGLHINGLIDNGLGNRIHNDLSGGRRTVDGVVNRKYFNRVGNDFRRRSFLSRANFCTKNFRSGSLLGGRNIVVVEGIIFRSGEL